MAVYPNTHNGGFYVEFQFKGKRYKKRLPPHIKKDEAEHFERQWRAEIIKERVVAGEPVCFDIPSEAAPLLQIGRRSKRKILYVVQSADIFKIGITDNFESRLKTMQTSNPHGIQARLILRVDNADIIEKRLHTMFKSKRVSGEWFRLNEDDLEFFRCILKAKQVFNKC